MLRIVGFEQRPMAEIKAIDRSSVHRICSGQVVLSLAVAVKELVENGIDAGATTIDVKLRDHGLEKIEVTDNGSGVDRKNYQNLTLKHYTSKIQEFADLSSVDTFGFRGEALSSLCALSSLSVTTCTAIDPCGTLIQYDKNGKKTSEAPIAHKPGTTVTLKNLFAGWPVRVRELKKNIKKEFGKMVQLLQGYCLVRPDIRFKCMNITSKGSRTSVLSTPGNTNLIGVVPLLFGRTQAPELMQFVMCSQHNDSITSDRQSSRAKVSGYISKASGDCGRSASDRQFLSINNRPCDIPKLSKVVNEVYKQYAKTKYPVYVLNIELPKDEVDVNVTPDKRSVFTLEESKLHEMVRSSLVEMWDPSRNSYTLETPSLAQSSLSNFVTKSDNFTTKSDADEIHGDMNSNSDSSADKRLNNPLPDRDPMNVNDAEISMSKSANSDTPTSAACDNKIGERPPHGVIDLGAVATKRPLEADLQANETSAGNWPNEPQAKFAKLDNIGLLDEDCDHISCHCAMGFKSFSMAAKTFNNQKSGVGVAKRTTYICAVRGCTKYQIDLGNLAALKQHYKKKHPRRESPKPTVCEYELPFSQQTVSSSNQSQPSDNPSTIASKKSTSIELIANTAEPDVTEAAEIIYDEDALTNMGIRTGSKNLIQFEVELSTVARLPKPFSVSFSPEIVAQSVQNSTQEKPSSGDAKSFSQVLGKTTDAEAEAELDRTISKKDFLRMEILGQFNLGFIVARLRNDLFIVDQHASEEKYYFEKLQRETKMQSQILVVPQRLELTAVHETVVMDNLEIFQRNGFDFVFDMDADVTKRVRLTKVPYSKNIVFGANEVDELVYMLADSPGVMCQPSRLRAMFASRACRRSVMIGTALNKSTMRKIVDHMETMEHPWNCPHGRPTMRYMFNLADMPSSNKFMT